MISLRVKLVAYFLVLSLLPLTAGAWAFSSSLVGHERQRVDERLTAELRAAVAAYRERSGGIHPRSAAERLLRTLTARSGIAATDRLVIVSGGRIAAGPHTGASFDPPTGRIGTVELSGERYRVAAATTSSNRWAARLAIATPQAPIDASKASAQRRLLAGVVGSLLLIALLAYAEGVSIVRAIQRFVGVAQAIAEGRLDERVPVRTRDEFGQLGAAFNEMADQLEAQRRRLHQATLRFGEALAAAHDIDQLLAVIVTTAVESTRATGGTIRGAGGEIARAGIPAAGTDIARSGIPAPGDQTISVRLEVGGESFGTLSLTGPHFEDEDRELVASLASHAVTALENARLHQIVQRQALVDPLTGMPNRRQCEAALATELSQAQRVGTPLVFVLADLDHFKSINDRHGHPVGDRVLREFSDILRELMRESDLAARWGGEEFALVLPNTDEKGATVLMERIRSMLEHRAITVEGYLLSVTASFGVAMYPQEATAAGLIAAADEALYIAKRAGRNRVETARAMPLSA